MSKQCACLQNSTDGTISKVHEFQNHLKEHDKRGIHIYSKPPVVSGCGREVVVLDRRTELPKKMLMFGSNSYLNATRDAKCVDKSLEVIKTFGIGTGGVPLLSGTMFLPSCPALELELCQLIRKKTLITSVKRWKS